MKPSAHVLMAHNVVAGESPADVQNVLEQAAHVARALEGTGYQVSQLEVGLDLGRAVRSIGRIRPDVIFNLVETIGDDGRLAPVASGLFEHLQIPFTGSRTSGLFLTSNKILTKKWLRASGLATPDWWVPGGKRPAADGAWIVKPVWEDASIGIDDESVVANFDLVDQRLQARKMAYKGEWFVERYIEGREINIALLCGEDEPRVLPISEILFIDYPSIKPRIVGYSAKWDEDSFEGRNTVRQFIDRAHEGDLCRRLENVGRTCWRLFGLDGYVRVDCRVDEAGDIWILEVNANPCISPDAGFAAALAEDGLGYNEAIDLIVRDAKRRGSAHQLP